MGCVRCSSEIGTHNAECRGRIEGILLQQSRTKPKTRRGATRWPNDDEVSADGIGEANGASNAVGQQWIRCSAKRCPQYWAMQAADETPPEASDVEMGPEDSCEAQVKRAKTTMGLEICVLEAQVDVDDETPGTLTNSAETSGERATDEDAVAPEVTEELNRLKTLGRAYKAPSVDELMPLRYVYTQKTNERLDDQMVAEGRERELSTLCSQDALFVIPGTASRPRTTTVRGRFVDDMKNGRVKSRFVAAEVARDVRHDVHAGTPALEVFVDDCQPCCNA